MDVLTEKQVMAPPYGLINVDNILFTIFTVNHQSKYTVILVRFD
jgi:hypothetical protein